VFEYTGSQKSVGELAAASPSSISSDARRIEIERLSIMEKRYGSNLDPASRQRLEELRALEAEQYEPAQSSVQLRRNYAEPGSLSPQAAEAQRLEATKGTTNQPTEGRLSITTSQLIRQNPVPPQDRPYYAYEKKDGQLAPGTIAGQRYLITPPGPTEVRTITPRTKAYFGGAVPSVKPGESVAIVPGGNGYETAYYTSKGVKGSIVTPDPSASFSGRGYTSGQALGKILDWSSMKAKTGTYMDVPSSMDFKLRGVQLGIAAFEFGETKLGEAFISFGKQQEQFALSMEQGKLVTPPKSILTVNRPEQLRTTSKVDIFIGDFVQPPVFGFKTAVAVGGVTLASFGLPIIGQGVSKGIKYVEKVITEAKWYERLAPKIEAKFPQLTARSMALKSLLGKGAGKAVGLGLTGAIGYTEYKRTSEAARPGAALRESVQFYLPAGALGTYVGTELATSLESRATLKALAAATRSPGPRVAALPINKRTIKIPAMDFVKPQVYSGEEKYYTMYGWLPPKARAKKFLGLAFESPFAPKDPIMTSGVIKIPASLGFKSIVPKSLPDDITVISALKPGTSRPVLLTQKGKVKYGLEGYGAFHLGPDIIPPKVRTVGPGTTPGEPRGLYTALGGESLAFLGKTRYGLLSTDFSLGVRKPFAFAFRTAKSPNKSANFFVNIFEGSDVSSVIPKIKGKGRIEISPVEWVRREKIPTDWDILFGRKPGYEFAYQFKKSKPGVMQISGVKPEVESILPEGSVWRTVASKEIRFQDRGLFRTKVPLLKKVAIQTKGFKITKTTPKQGIMRELELESSELEKPVGLLKPSFQVSRSNTFDTSRISGYTSASSTAYSKPSSYLSSGSSSVFRSSTSSSLSYTSSRPSSSYSRASDSLSSSLSKASRSISSGYSSSSSRRDSSGSRITRKPTPKVPDVWLPRLPGLEQQRKKPLSSPGRSFRYTASLIAVSKNIKGAMPKKLTGFEIRPMPLSTSIKKRRRKK
jgi:hypothetical protein